MDLGLGRHLHLGDLRGRLVGHMLRRAQWRLLKMREVHPDGKDEVRIRVFTEGEVDIPVTKGLALVKIWERDFRELIMVAMEIMNILEIWEENLEIMAIRRNNK
jgi:hypothetical protein